MFRAFGFRVEGLGFCRDCGDGGRGEDSTYLFPAVFR